MASMRWPEGSQLHGAATERGGQASARGFSHLREPPPRRPGQTVVGASFSSTRRGEGARPLSSRLRSAVSISVVGMNTQKSANKNKTQQKNQRESRHEYIARDDKGEKHKVFSLTTTGNFHCP